MTRYAKSLLGRGVLTMAVALVLTAPAPAQSTRDVIRSSPKVLAAFKDVVAQPSDSVVRVLCDDKETALGTVVGCDGWVLTKASDLKGKVVCKTRDGRTFEARVVGVEDKYDLAMLKVEAKGLPAVTLKESKATLVGYWVASVGQSSEPVAVGVVSVASRNPSPREYPRSVSPSSGYLGIGLAETDDGGAKIAEVMKDSAAAKAGLEKDDLILAVGPTVIKNGDALITTLAKFKAGDEVKLKVRRGESELELKATLGKRPQSGLFDRSDMQNRMGSELSAKRTGFPTILQHDSVVRPQDCGGPLVNLEGHVIGINIARAGRVESWAIPAEAIQPLLFDLSSGKFSPPQTVSTGPTDKVTAAKAALEKAQKELAEAQKRVTAAQDALKKEEEAARKEKDKSTSSDQESKR